MAAPDAFGLNGVGGFAQAGGIDEHHGDAANVGGFFNGIACGAGGGGDDSAIVPEQLIEQAGFAGVRAADDGGADSAAQDAAFVGCGEQFIDES